MNDNRLRVYSGAPWEKDVGYCRAIRIGALIEVSGTVAIKDGKVVCEGDPYGQTKYILSIIEDAIRKLGGSIEQTIRTRTFVTDINAWEEVGRAHGEVFREIRPVSSMLEVSNLIVPGLMVEIEATCLCGGFVDNS